MHAVQLKPHVFNCCYSMRVMRHLFEHSIVAIFAERASDRLR